jgi:hypothetical protein
MFRKDATAAHAAGDRYLPLTFSHSGGIFLNFLGVSSILDLSGRHPKSTYVVKKIPVFHKSNMSLLSSTFAVVAYAYFFVYVSAHPTRQ